MATNVDEFASRREVDQLRSDVNETRQSVEALKAGNAAVAVLSTQISTITRDVSELKSDVNTRFSRHEEVHEADEKARLSGRRWLIGTMLSAIAILAGLYGWIALLLHK